MIERLRGPCYIRYAREATPIVTREGTPYKFGIATVIRYRGEKQQFIDAFETVLSTDAKNENEDIAIIACGPEVPEAMRAAWILKEEFGIDGARGEYFHVKPLDKEAHYCGCSKETGAALDSRGAPERRAWEIWFHQQSSQCSSMEPVVFDMIGVKTSSATLARPGS